MRSCLTSIAFSSDRLHFTPQLPSILDSKQQTLLCYNCEVSRLFPPTPNGRDRKKCRVPSEIICSRYNLAKPNVPISLTRFNIDLRLRKTKDFFDLLLRKKTSVTVIYSNLCVMYLVDKIYLRKLL